MKTTPETLVRPVRCHFCGQPMHYGEHALHVPEVRVTVCGDRDESSFYAHDTCWNERMRPAASSSPAN